MHGDGKHGKDVPNEEGAREDGERGNMGCGNVAGTNAGHELHAASAAHDGTGADAGCAGADDSDGDGDKEVGSAYGSTESDGYALVPGSALQLDPGGAWLEDVESAVGVTLWEGVEVAVVGRMLNGLGKAFLAYYQIRTLVVRKN